MEFILGNDTFVRIGGPLIESPDSLTDLKTLQCRNTKKPTKAKWLLGEEYPADIDIEWKGRIPQMSWRMNNKIKRWRITWRDSTPMNKAISLDINGDLGSALMMFHRMTVLVLPLIEDEMWPNTFAALVVVHPIRVGDGKDDYISVVLDATLCCMELSTGACALPEEHKRQWRARGFKGKEG